MHALVHIPEHPELLQLLPHVAKHPPTQLTKHQPEQSLAEP